MQPLNPNASAYVPTKRRIEGRVVCDGEPGVSISSQGVFIDFSIAKGPFMFIREDDGAQKVIRPTEETMVRWGLGK